jgi:hypothetical protein
MPGENFFLRNRLTMFATVRDTGIPTRIIFININKKISLKNKISNKARERMTPIIIFFFTS